MSELTLFLSRGACSMAAHIALLEAGAEFSAVHVALNGEQHGESYSKVNPRGQVPALKVGDQVLTENVAVLTWIAKSYPDANLLPAGNILEEAQSLSYLAWLSTAVHKAFGPLFHATNFVDSEQAQAELKQHAIAQVKSQFKEINERLGGQDYALGHFSVADAYLFVFYRWAEKLFDQDLSEFPHYAAHQERLLKRDSVQRMLAAEQQLAEAA